LLVRGLVLTLQAGLELLNAPECRAVRDVVVRNGQDPILRDGIVSLVQKPVEFSVEDCPFQGDDAVDLPTRGSHFAYKSSFHETDWAMDTGQLPKECDEIAVSVLYIDSEWFGARHGWSLHDAFSYLRGPLM
jgi:hypothetical protein